MKRTLALCLCLGCHSEISHRPSDGGLTHPEGKAKGHYTLIDPSLPSPSPSVEPSPSPSPSVTPCGELDTVCCIDSPTCAEGLECSGDGYCAVPVPAPDMVSPPDMATPPDMTEPSPSPDMGCPYDNNGQLTDKPGHGKCRL